MDAHGGSGGSCFVVVLPAPAVCSRSLAEKLRCSANPLSGFPLENSAAARCVSGLERPCKRCGQPRRCLLLMTFATLNVQHSAPGSDPPSGRACTSTNRTSAPKPSVPHAADLRCDSRNQLGSVPTAAPSVPHGVLYMLSAMDSLPGRACFRDTTKLQCYSYLLSPQALFSPCSCSR